ncbi:hypothetical protein RJ639_016676 [Escallonia herrerae]|uniref:Reverse transcriptase RNase H-like domain-containing protein n=1 Tax=Escallonia herrerae TaxID=1293975 RepID=A0AA89ALG2_9ASTE|nr:hypothetical protein RJ639_016676 [Escallonia herrerae]
MPLAMEEREDRKENTGMINTISGGLTTEGSSGQAQKAYTREVCITSQPPNKKQKTIPIAIITFFDEDLKDVKTPPDDPLVITIKAGNFDVSRRYYRTPSCARYTSVTSQLYARFCGDKGPLRIQRHIGTTSTQSVTGCGLDLPPQDEVSHETWDWRGERRPDYSSSVLHDFMQIEEQGSTYYRRPLRRYKKMQRGEPVEDLVSIEVYPGEEKKTIQIGLNLKEDTKLELVNLLRTYADVFAWTATDMPGIDHEVITYREEDGVQKPIYYISKVDVETRYSKIDKIALALIISARRLRPYFQSHAIVVLTDQPLIKVLMSPEASERLVNWSIELGEFDIQYKPLIAIKAQALADFIVECTLPEDPPRLVIFEVPDPWNLYVDGSSAIGSSGTGIYLINPEGFMVEYALRFGFQASNNEAEYEEFSGE